MLLECQPNQTRIVDFWLIVNFWASAIFYYSVSNINLKTLSSLDALLNKNKDQCYSTGWFRCIRHPFLRKVGVRTNIHSDRQTAGQTVEKLLHVSINKQILLIQRQKRNDSMARSLDPLGFGTTHPPCSTPIARILKNLKLLQLHPTY